MFQREALRYAVVDDCLPIVVEGDDLLTVEPPDRSGVRANRETHVRHFVRRMDDCGDGKQDIRRRPVQRVREVIQVHVVGQRIDRMPRDLCVAHLCCLAVTRERSELLLQIIVLDDRLDCALRELSTDGKRLEEQPALQEPFARRCLHR